MNDQEMQFADPEWKPRQGQYGTYTDADQQPYIPRPINDDPTLQARPEWEEGPEPERVYKAQDLPNYQIPPTPPPTMSSPYQYQYSYGQARPRRRRSPWLWIVLALIVLSILGGLMRSTGSSYGPMPMKHAYPGQQAPFSQVQTYKVDNTTAPTIVINDAEGDVQVQASSNPYQVTVGTDGSANPAVDTISSNTLDITASNSEDITVTVPDNANLTIITDSGDITVGDINGQMTLTSQSGSITMQNVTLTGNSTIKSGDGDITFSGNITPNGSYQFISTDSGTVNLALPTSSPFSLHATTVSGSINADSAFSQVQVQQAGPGATAQGDNGNAPRASVTITSGSGDINLNAQ